MDTINIISKRMSASGIVDDKAIGLLNIVAVSDDGGNGTVILYDGQTSSDDKKLSVYILDGDTKQLIFNHPVIFSSGMYFSKGSNITEVLIQYVRYAPEI